MAEFVQLRAERTISELEQMQRIELFTKEEIRSIAAKRKRYEYKMGRIQKSKDVFLRYIQYELDVIRLIKLRREKTQITFKQKEIDLAIADRINGIFTQATSRHKTDIKLWMSHIKFCMQWNMKGTISAILSRMLAVLSNKVKVWKFAAKWEFESNDSIETARQLMLRGLRFHPKSKALYKAYLTMELQHAENKRSILEQKDILENDLIEAEVELMERKLKKSNTGNQTTIKTEVAKKGKRVKTPKHKLDTKLVEIIFDSALIRFRDVQSLIDIFGVVKEFKHAEPFLRKILQQLHERFPYNELVYDFDAIMNLEKDSTAAMCKAAYCGALTTLPTEQMWSLYLETLYSVNEISNNELSSELVSCHQLNLLNEKFYPKLITLLLDEKSKDALPTLITALSQFPKNGELHLLHVKTCLSQQSEKDALCAFESAAAALGNNNLDMLALYKAVIQHYENVNFPLAEKFFKRSVFSGPNVSTGLKPCYLQWVYDKRGLSVARIEYNAMGLVPPLCLKLHYKMIDLEMMQSDVSVQNVRLCYEKASHQFGERDADLWMKFIAFETEKGDPKLAPLVFTRAKACLAVDLLDEFVTQHTINRIHEKA